MAIDVAAVRRLAERVKAQVAAGGASNRSAYLIAQAALRLADELEQDRRNSYLHADGSHRYVSTACLHGQHSYCAAPTGAYGKPKAPAECKFGNDPCMCAAPDCAHRSVVDLLAAAQMLNIRELPGEDGVWQLDGPHQPQRVTAWVWMLQDAGWLDSDFGPTAAGLRVLEAESC